MITKDLIVKFMDGHIEERAPDNWCLTTRAGRKIPINKNGIDLQTVFMQLQPGESWEQWMQLRFATLALVSECLGIVSTDGLAYEITAAVIAEAKEYHFRVDAAGYRPFSTAQARRRFGDEARVQVHWSNAKWWVVLPDGRAALFGKNAKDNIVLLFVRGDSSMYKSALLFLCDLQKFAVVSGSREHVTNGILNAWALDVEIVAEVNAFWVSATLWGAVCVAVASLLLRISGIAACDLSLFWLAAVIASVAAIANVAMHHSLRALKHARLRGRELMACLPHPLRTQ
jgi:hypothetical protein